MHPTYFQFESELCFLRFCDSGGYGFQIIWYFFYTCKECLEIGVQI